MSVKTTAQSLGYAKIKNIKDYRLTEPDINMDIYTQCQLRGLIDKPLQLQQILTNAFTRMMARLPRLDPELSAGQIFSRVGNPVCFNYMSQFLRITVIKCVSYCLAPDKRTELQLDNLHLMDNPAYIPVYQKLFDYLVRLNASNVILWFFFQVPIYQNFSVAGYRKVYNAMLDYAIDKWPPELSFDIARIQATKSPPYELASRGSTFYYNLAYQGQSNRELITKWNVLLRKIYPQVQFTSKYMSPVIAPSSTTGAKYTIPKDNKLLYLLDIYESEKGLSAPTAKKLQYPVADTLGASSIAKIRVCFISNKMVQYTSVFRDRIGIINNLDRRYFDVYLAVYTSLDRIMENNPIVWSFLEHMHKTQRLIYLKPNDLRYNQTTITEGKYHIIIYPDLGMLQDQTLLAQARLAPIQCVTWGHSDTSGCQELDYYITSRFFENTDNLAIPKSNYSETPILLKTSGTYYYSPLKIVDKYLLPNPKQSFKSATELGFPPNALIVGCLQSFFKFNNDFEQVLGLILRRTAGGIGAVGGKAGRPVYLALSNSIPFNKLHLERIGELFKGYTERIIWFQNKTPDEWLNLVSVCHVMLDPFPFGGCNTTLEAFEFGIPVVCRPTNVINGRFTRGFYEIMGIDLSWCCCNTADEYVELVHRLLRDDHYYMGVNQSILNNKHKLFEQPDTVADYQTMMVKLLRRHLPSASGGAKPV